MAVFDVQEQRQRFAVIINVVVIPVFKAMRNDGDLLQIVQRILQIHVPDVDHTASLLVSLIELIHSHVHSATGGIPEWFAQLKEEVEGARKTV
jgi:hypothetical protein